MLGQSRPPADAFAELVTDGDFPPGYLWPVAFTSKKLLVWGAENLAACVEFLNQTTMDSTLGSTQEKRRLSDMEAGRAVSGSELLYEHVVFSMSLLGVLIDACHRRLVDGLMLSERMAGYVKDIRDSGGPLPALAPFVAPELAMFVDLVHGGLSGLDLRIGCDLGVASWDPGSPSSVHDAMLVLIEREVQKTVALLGLDAS